MKSKVANLTKKWTKKKSSALAENYKTYIGQITSPPLRKVLLSGLGAFVQLPDKCQETLKLFSARTEKLKTLLTDAGLTSELNSIATNEIAEDEPEKQILWEYERLKLHKRINEMIEHRDSILDHYPKIIWAVMIQSIEAAKKLSENLGDTNFKEDLAISALHDSVGLVFPPAGTVSFLYNRLVKRSNYVQSQLANNADVANSFAEFSDFMRDLTVKFSEIEVGFNADIEVLIDFVKNELPSSIQNLREISR